MRDEDPPNKSQALRARLASVGIYLDEEKPAPRPATAPQPAAVDRELVREILIAACAPARDLSWLVASCPSVAHARGYRPPGAP